MGYRRTKRKPKYLKITKQGVDESLREFLLRFNEKVLLVEGLRDDKAIRYAWAGMQPHKFTYSLAKKHPKTMGELMKKAQHYIQAEKEMALKQVEMRVAGTVREPQEDTEIARRNKGDKGSGKKTARQSSPLLLRGTPQ